MDGQRKCLLSLLGIMRGNLKYKNSLILSDLYLHINFNNFTDWTQL